MTSIDLERREPAQNMKRFYAIIVTRTPVWLRQTLLPLSGFFQINRLEPRFRPCKREPFRAGSEDMRENGGGAHQRPFVPRSRASRPSSRSLLARTRSMVPGLSSSAIPTGLSRGRIPA